MCRDWKNFEMFDSKSRDRLEKIAGRNRDIKGGRTS